MYLNFIQQPPQVADQRQRLGRLGRAPARLPCIAIADGCTGASPAVHPAPFPPVDGRRLALLFCAGPGQTAPGLRQSGRWQGGVVNFGIFLDPRVMMEMIGQKSMGDNRLHR